MKNSGDLSASRWGRAFGGMAALCILAASSMAQPSMASTADQAVPAPTPTPAPAEGAIADEHHQVDRSIVLRGKKLGYAVDAGRLVISRPDGKPYHAMSYTAYVADGPDKADRPITFIWNGGPGGSSMWLHMGAFGPRRIVPPTREWAGAAPYGLFDNQYTLLDQTDLVFIDAPYSGFSRPVGDGTPKDIKGVEPDARAFTRFILRYLSLNNRWNSPKFLFGESYGTTRAALVARMLQEGRVELNGVAMLSTMFDMNNLAINFPSQAKGPDNWYVGTLPSFAAAAWYHGKAGRGETLDAWVAKARRFALDRYTAALMQGDLLPAPERDAIATQMADIIGLSPGVIKAAALRLSTFQFRTALLQEEGKVIGRFDTRTKGDDPNAFGGAPTYDAAFAARNGVYLGSLMTYLANELKVPIKQPYVWSYDDILEGFEWSHPSTYPGSGNLPTMASSTVGPDLAATVRQNPGLRIFVASGLMDLATPFFLAEQDVSHLGLGSEGSQVVRIRNYAGGHTVYEDESALHAYRDDLRQFYKDALAARTSRAP